jgi:hypothetical protein
LRWVLACVLSAAVVAGCGADGKSSYTSAEIKKAYFRAADESTTARPLVQDSWVDSDAHQHTNYVAPEGIETCPQAQRANANVKLDKNYVEPNAAEPVGQLLIGPKSPDDIRTPQITQGALVFGTKAIAGNGMEIVGKAIGKCPATYEVTGGPSPLIGTYNVTSREYDSGGWKGYVQQIAHTNPADNVYYEDAAHLIVSRANVILYFNVTHHKIIGERSDSSAKAEAVLQTVRKRLG